MSATPTVAIVAPGNMGAGVGRRLTENKVTVLTSIAGRSEESAKRAREAGMRPVEERALAEADFFLYKIMKPAYVALRIFRRKQFLQRLQVGADTVYFGIDMSQMLVVAGNYTTAYITFHGKYINLQSPEVILNT